MLLVERVDYSVFGMVVVLRCDWKSVRTLGIGCLEAFVEYCCRVWVMLVEHVSYDLGVLARSIGVDHHRVLATGSGVKKISCKALRTEACLRLLEREGSRAHRQSHSRRLKTQRQGKGREGPRGLKQ
jgi:hypothetical protein